MMTETEKLENIPSSVNDKTLLQSSFSNTSIIDFYYDSTSKISSPYPRIHGNFLVVWLDTSSDEMNENSRDLLVELQNFSDTIITFRDVDACLDFITDIAYEKVFMILSPALGEQIISFIHDMPQLDVIYIFHSGNPVDDEWIKHWRKIKGITTKPILVGESFRQNARRCDQNSISISVIENTDVSNNNLDSVDQTFMYIQLFKEISLETEYGDRLHGEFDFAANSKLSKEFQQNRRNYVTIEV